MDEEVPTRFLWLAMLLKADRQGIVHGTPGALARLANMERGDVESSLKRLQEPDPASTSEDDDGRRLKLLSPNKWLLINYEKYREMAQKDRDRQLNAEAAKRYREGVKGGGMTDNDRHGASSSVMDRHGTVMDSASVSGSVLVSGNVSNTGKKKNTGSTRARFVKPKASEVQAYLDERGETRFSGEEFCDGNEQKGWLVGRTRTPMKDWQAAVRTWQRERDKQGQKQRGVTREDDPGDAWMYDTYRKSCRDTHGNHSRWEEYLMAAADYPARQAPRFADWLKEDK